MPGGTPRFVSVFDPSRCIFVFVDKMAEKILTSPIKFSCLYLPVFIFLFCFYFEVGECRNFDLLKYYTPYRKKTQPLCVYMFIYIYINIMGISTSHM